MPRIPIFRLGGAPDQPAPPELSSSTPSVSLEGLTVGVDNLRHDVVLSSRFAEAARVQIAKLIARHGELEGLLAAEAASAAASRAPSWMRQQAGTARAKSEPAEWKAVLGELHVAALNRAKREGKVAVDLLARLAVMKFLRTEMNQQFAQVLERCRVQLKGYDGSRQQKALEHGERLGTFQVRKKIILRKTGQDLFETLREVEKGTLARTRRSLFGGREAGPDADTYALFVNRLAFSDDGRDDYLCAEHYVMLGNWDRDSDRYGRLREIVSVFLRSVYGEETSGEAIAAGGAAITDANNSTAYVCSGQDGQPGKDGTPFSGTFTSSNGAYSISVSVALPGCSSTAASWPSQTTFSPAPQLHATSFLSFSPNAQIFTLSRAP